VSTTPRTSRRTILGTATSLSALAILGRTGLATGEGHSPSLVTEARKGLKGVIARFTQTRTVGLLAADVKSTGTMTIVTPDRLRWELAAPDAITYWIGPEGIAYRTEKGVVKAGKDAAGRFGAVLGDLLVFLGGDIAALAPRYVIKAPSRDKDGTLHVVAEPRTDDVKKLVKVVRFDTTPDLWAVKRVEIEEASGDKSVIDFGPSQRDPKIDAGIMRPPKA
jgi:outer membrane lipoprotein-sorting protein